MNLYQTEQKTTYQISDIFGVSATTVGRWLSFYDIKKRKSGARTEYKVNKDYFEVIDTQEKAYWLGFIWCDGYIGRRDRNGIHEYWFELALNKFDEAHLEKLNNAMDSNYKIKKIKNVSSKSKNDHKVSLRIYNQDFCKLIYNTYGLFANRNDSSKVFSHIPEEHYRHFIRGVIDADGSIVVYFDKHNQKESSTISVSNLSLDLLQKNQKYLIEQGLQNQLITPTQRHEGDCYHLKINGIIQTPTILKHLYDGATVYLDRKYQKYKETIIAMERREVFF